MIALFIKEVLNSLKRVPLISLINLAGISIAMAASIAIFSYVRYENKVNSMFSASDRIFLISTGDGKGFHGTNVKLGQILSGLPEVELFTRVGKAGEDHVINAGNNPVYAGKMMSADSVFFRIFDFRFKYGNPVECLQNKFDIVISETLCEKMFGKINPVGLNVWLDTRYMLTVRGVIYETENKTHFDADAYISLQSMPELINWKELFECWNCYNYHTYVMFKNETDMTEEDKRINDLLDAYGQNNSIESLVSNDYTLIDLNEVYFGKETRPYFRKGNKRLLYLLGTIGSIILLVAIINYINLASTVSIERIRNIRQRKTAGASRFILFANIIGEGVFLCLIGSGAGLLLVLIMDHYVGSLMGIDIRISLTEDRWLLMYCFIIAVSTGLVSSVYPAFLISGAGNACLTRESSYNPAFRRNIQNLLTIFQLSASVTLIGCTVVLYCQLNYISNSDPGFDRDKLVYMPVNEQLKKCLDPFRKRLIEHPGIDKVAMSQSSYQVNKQYRTFEYEGREAGLHFEYIDENYLDVLGLRLIRGRGFRGGEDEGKMIVNKEACRQIFGDDVIGSRVNLYFPRPVEIVGVVDDYLINTFYHEIEPVGLMYKRVDSLPQVYRQAACTVRLNGIYTKGALEHMELAWNEFSPSYPFDYTYVDNHYSNMYGSEQRIMRMLFALTFSSIFITCLGIFGIAYYSVIRRSHEIAVRKVNGAGVIDVIGLLYKNINPLLFIASVPSCVMIFIFMNRWLSAFAYHIKIYWWIYILSVFSVWIISVMTSVATTIKTARKNPSSVLNNE